MKDEGEEEKGEVYPGIREGNWKGRQKGDSLRWKKKMGRAKERKGEVKADEGDMGKEGRGKK